MLKCCLLMTRSMATVMNTLDASLLSIAKAGSRGSQIPHVTYPRRSPFVLPIDTCRERQIRLDLATLLKMQACLRSKDGVQIIKMFNSYQYPAKWTLVYLKLLKREPRTDSSFFCVHFRLFVCPLKNLNWGLTISSKFMSACLTRQP